MIARLCAAALALLLTCDGTAAARGDRFTLEARDSDLADVLRLLGAQGARNVVADGSIRPLRVTIRLRDVSFDEALATLSAAYGLQAHRDGRVTIVGDAAAMNRRYPDDASAGGVRTAIVQLRHARPEEVAAALVPALPPGTVIVPDKRTTSVVLSGSAVVLERARLLIAALDAPSGQASGETHTVQLHNVKASEAVRAVRAALPENTLFADDRQNVVVVSGGADAARLAGSLLSALDAPGSQVMFEVRVADVEPVNDNENVGFTFGGAGYGSGALGQLPYSITKSSVVVNAQLNALVQHGHASILAQPRVATLNNHEATLLVGEQYPVVTVNQQTGFPTVQTIDVGVRLRLTPTIGADGSITADVHPEFSQIIGFNNSFPIVANRKVDATLRVHDGETIVLGGLFQDIDSETVTKLPFLGDVPILGSVFRNRQHSRNKDEVVFFITPRIVNAPAPEVSR